MAIDIVARGLASSLTGADGKISSDKMPVLTGTSELTGFYPLGRLTDPSLIEGKTAEEILLMMLYGVVNPTLIDPSLVFALSEESKTPVIGRQSLIKGTLTFNRGSISPAYGTSGYRAGDAIEYSIGDTKVVTNQDNCDFEIELTPSTDKIVLKYSVTHGAGEQPVNSAGQSFGAPYPAGTIAHTIEIPAAYALYSAQGSDQSFEWFSDDEGQGYLSAFASEAGGAAKQSFAVSENITVVGVKAFDVMTQKWTWLGGTTAANSLKHFDISVISGSDLGEATNYICYTHNQPASGKRELRIYVI